MVYVLIHVRHVYDKALGRPVDSVRWHSVHESFEAATEAAEVFVTEKNLISEIPLYVWWSMGTNEENPHTWWMSNEFGPKKDVGNSCRITMRVAKIGA